MSVVVEINGNPIKGKWKRVISSNEVYVGQRIRYKGALEHGYNDNPRYIHSITDDGIVKTYDGKGNQIQSADVFGIYNFVEVFFEKNEDLKKEVNGEWRKITCADEVYVGQQVRYNGCNSYGYGNEQKESDRYRYIHSITSSGIIRTYDGENDIILSHDVLVGYNNVEAFFPFKNESKRELFVKITSNSQNYWRFETTNITSISYSSRELALNASQDFFKNKLGFLGHIYYYYI